jgi:hypothetical protein
MNVSHVRFGGNQLSLEARVDKIERYLQDDLLPIRIATM